MKKILLLILLSFSAIPAFASHEYLEKEYQKHWCSINKGSVEVRLQDNTRIDCLTDEYAIEFDFALKWAESIGQALYYSHCTGKKAGVVLIMENGQKDEKYLARLNAVAKRYGITVWTMSPADMPCTKTSCRK